MEAKTKIEKKIEPTFQKYESREKEPFMFDCAEFRPTRNFSSGRLEWEIPSEDVPRFERHHFVEIGRIVRML